MAAAKFAAIRDCRIETGSGVAAAHTNPTRKRGTPAEASDRCIAVPLACASGWYGDGHRTAGDCGVAFPGPVSLL